MALPITPTEQARIDAEIADMLARLSSYEVTYLATNRRYWQGIKNPQDVPLDIADSNTNSRLKPTDQAEDWRGPTISSRLPISVEVHTHKGPRGDGYTVYFWADLGRVIYQRAVGVGFHSETYDWKQFITE